MSKLIDHGGFYVAENAVVTGDVRCAKGVNVWFGAVIRADLAPIVIGEYTNVQDLCVMHTDPDEDLVIGKNVTLGHNAVIHGRRIGDACLIGMGAILLGGSEIGEGCLIGAGTLVREKQIIPPHSIAVGVPARIIGKTDAKTIADHLARAQGYCRNAMKYVK